jgi:putative heme-binding domain-containing protein
VVDLFEVTRAAFAEEPGGQYTINGVHLNERGDELIGREIDRQLFGELPSFDVELYERLRRAINNKSWFHLQDYRMLNGWYVYGGRRTWDTETFPTEFRKIREMVAVRDQYVWDMAAGRNVPAEPDDSVTGQVYIPETMFGTRDDNFREMREPKTLEYPTPEESIAQMSMPEEFEVKLFVSEREFPELANPAQIAFDDRGRLWVSCMANYPQWLPNSSKPNDRLLIFEDSDGDGRADECKVFYDKLICPTGFEFYNGGVLVVDEPRILFLKDTDGDDVADHVVRLLDGIATDDTHHAMGAWEWSHGGLLHMQEGISMSTTLETPWGPFRIQGPSGSYVWDLPSLKIRHFRTPSYGNPWCLVFDAWGNGVIGDGTNAQQHWASLLSGAAVQSRRSVQPIFNNEGMRPAVGSDFLYSRQFPDNVQGKFIYACVINMHGMPMFEVQDEQGTAGFTGQRVNDLLSSTDMFFRPVDPKIGPDGALWFGDWCNALIGHMQYSQRDPNRDHVHGRIYRMVAKDKPLLQPAIQAGKSIAELLEQLNAYETRTRYRARRALRDRDSAEVLAAVDQWLAQSDSPRQWCEGLWLQEWFHQVDPDLVARILDSDDFHARAAAIHVVGNQWEWMEDPNQFLRRGIADNHPRVRLEALRAVSFQSDIEAVAIALSVMEMPTDPWIDYVLEHTLQALQPVWSQALNDESFLANASPSAKQALIDYQHATGPGAKIFKPLRVVADPDRSEAEHRDALAQLVAAGGGSRVNGAKVFERTCAACHLHGNIGKEFGPKLTDVGERLTKEQIIRSIVWPNEEISKGYETVMVLTYDGQTFNGFVLREDDESLTLGVANGKTEVIDKEEIDAQKPMKASSMPEGLLQTIAPSEFLDLIRFLSGDWIRTDENQRLPLRKHGQWVEVSRQSQVQIDNGFPEQWNQEVNRLLSGKQPRRFDFAFHSANASTESTDVIIRLKHAAEIRHVEIENRRSEEFHDRADGLAMWTSDDGEHWKKVWRSEQPQASWSFDLPKGTQAKFVKLALTQPGIFHLNQVVLYGRLLESSPSSGQDSGEPTPR